MNPPKKPLSAIQSEFHIALLPESKPKIHLSENGCRIDDNLTFEEWQSGLKTFKGIQNRLKLGLADYVQWGRVKWGDKAVEDSIAQLEFDLPTVKCVQQINGVPEPIRKLGLTPDHLVVLARADCTPKQREKWAKTAKEQNLTPTQLKHSIPAGEVVDPNVARDRNSGILSPHGIRHEFDIWLRRMNGFKGIVKHGEKVAKEICEEFVPIAELVDQLRDWIKKQ